MERLRHQLLSSHESHDRFGFSLLSDDLTVHSQVNINDITFQSLSLCNLPFFFLFKVIARRLEANGKPRVLLRWLPANV